MELTASQTQAVTTTQVPVAVIAGAGSGKTRVLIERFKHLVCDLEIPPAQIVAFTFTEKAAGEMQDRLLKEGWIKPEEMALTFVGTLHGFCARLLRKHGPLIGLDPEFKILDASAALLEKHLLLEKVIREKIEANGPLADAVRSLGFGPVWRMIQELSQEPELNDLLAPDALESALLATARELEERWTARNQSRCQTDFAGLETQTIRLFETLPQLKRRLAANLKHLLVDEYQDLNPTQVRLINLLYQPGANEIFVVGDPKQSIYRFRHADAQVFAKTVARLESLQGRTISLKETFRIPATIAAPVNKVFRELFDENPAESFFAPLIPTSDGGRFTLVYAPKNLKARADALRMLEAQWLAKDLAEKNLNPEELSRTAILFRSSSAMSAFQEALTRAGIPCRVGRSENLLKTDAVRDLLHVLAYFAGETSLLVQAGLLRSLFFSFSESFIDRYFSSSPPEDFLKPHTLDLFTTNDDRFKWEKLTSLFAKWSHLHDRLDPFTFLNAVVSDLNLLPPSTVIGDDQALYVDQWLALVRDIQRSENPTLKRLNELFNHALEMDAGLEALLPPSAAGAVQLLTIHASKGLEFDRVYLPQIHALTRHDILDYLIDDQSQLVVRKPDPQIPYGLKPKFAESPLYENLKSLEKSKEREEKKRLLYVAMTRARLELTVFLKEPSKRTKGTEGDKWNDWLWNLLESERADAVPLTESAKVPPLSFLRLADSLEKKFEAPPHPQENEPAPADVVLFRPGKPAALKPTYTVAAIETYLRCQKEYELGYVHGIKPTPGPHSLKTTSSHLGIKASQWGSFVHEVMQFLDFKTMANRQTVIEQALVNQQIGDSDGLIQKEVKSLLARLMDHADLWNFLTRPVNTQNEIPFFLDGGNFFLKGKIDRLVFDGGSWVVVDYKTDHIAGDDLEKRVAAYEGQMTCYALAVSKIMGLTEIKTALVFTALPELVVRQWESTDLEEAARTLDRVHEQMAAKAQIAPMKSASAYLYPQDKNVCRHCAYFERNYCGVRKSL